MFGYYKKVINTGRHGMQGKLADAYCKLLKDLWIGSDSKSAPHDLKRVLGKKIQMFAGYGQQDANELLTFLMDNIHEDLNRVKEKPFIEQPENKDGKSDEQMSKIWWEDYYQQRE